MVWWTEISFLHHIIIWINDFPSYQVARSNFRSVSPKMVFILRLAIYWHTSSDSDGIVRRLIFNSSSLVSNRVVYCSMDSLRCLVMVAKLRMRDCRWTRVESLFISLWSSVCQSLYPSALPISDEET